jgi:2-methylcitrate dehydratase PrpD
MFPLSSKGITDLPFYGVIGATVTAGKGLGLDKDQLKNSIGMSLGRASGYIVNFGTDAHYLESAAACRDGLMTALMAQKGMTGSADLEKWLLDLHRGTDINVSKITEGLGESRWRVHEIWVKKYPCCFLTHRHIDMMREILGERKVSCEEIDKVEIHVGPVDYTCDRPEPKDTEDARFSFQHIMAALMLERDIDSRHFSGKKMMDDSFVEARKKVTVINHSEWPAEFMSGVAKIKVLLYNGEEVVRESMQALGGPLNPLTKDQFADLYWKYTKEVLKTEDTSWTWEYISNLEEHEDLAQFLRKICFVGP